MQIVQCVIRKEKHFFRSKQFYFISPNSVRLKVDIYLGKEIDIYLADMNIGIEYDGKYFHSFEKNWLQIKGKKIF